MHRGIIGAANQNRTDDLILTKDVLYQLSHSSVSLKSTCIIISENLSFVKSFLKFFWISEKILSDRQICQGGKGTGAKLLQNYARCDIIIAQ